MNFGRNGFNTHKDGVNLFQFTPNPQLRQNGSNKCKKPELDQDGVDQVQRYVVYCAVYILSRVVLNTGKHGH